MFKKNKYDKLKIIIIDARLKIRKTLRIQIKQGSVTLATAIIFSLNQSSRLQVRIIVLTNLTIFTKTIELKSAM